MTSPEQKRALLVGSGHAHLAVIVEAERLREAGWSLTLLSPTSFSYSGMASATATAAVPAHAGYIDVASLAERYGVTHVDDLMASIDPEAGVVITQGGQEIGYDACSINIGSVVDLPGVQVAPEVLRVKPLHALVGLRDYLTGGPAYPGRRITVSIIGAGFSGLELAANLAARSDVEQVHLLEAGPAVGADLPRGAARWAERLIRRRGVRIHLGSAVESVDGGRLFTVDGEEIAHDVAVLATGLSAPSVLLSDGTQLGDRDGIPVNEQLCHPDHMTEPALYAVGDSAHFQSQPLPRIGVHGVRQGPVLVTSLVARRTTAKLPRYEPQRRALSILDLGGTGLAVRGRFWWPGRSALRVKHFIDRRWLDRYR